MASLKSILGIGGKELLIGEIIGRVGSQYTVKLRDKIVNISSISTGAIGIGASVFIADIENELKIIAASKVKVREPEEITVNG